MKERNACLNPISRCRQCLIGKLETKLRMRLGIDTLLRHCEVWWRLNTTSHHTLFNIIYIMRNDVFPDQPCSTQISSSWFACFASFPCELFNQRCMLRECFTERIPVTHLHVCEIKPR